MTVKTPGSQMGSPAAAEEGGEAHGHRHAMKRDRKVYYKTTTNVRVPMDCNFFRSSVGGT